MHYRPVTGLVGLFRLPWADRGRLSLSCGLWLIIAVPGPNLNRYTLVIVS